MQQGWGPRDGGTDRPGLACLWPGESANMTTAQMEGSRGQQTAIFPGSLCYKLGSWWVHSEGPGFTPGEGALSSRHIKMLL